MREHYDLAVEVQTVLCERLHVLIVDDDIELTEALADVLELSAVTVSVANSGEQALDLLQRQRFDCVLMDIMMPGLNGVETLKRARELSPGSVILLMTAYSVQELIDEAKREGALAVLGKPIDVDSFIEFLREFKERSSVLIVGDDPAFCQTMRNELAPRGYRTFIAKNLDEALATVSLHQYEIVLMSRGRKNRERVGALIAIRELNPKAVFVLLSRNGDVGRMRSRGIETESLIALTKPFDMDAIVALLEELRLRKLQQALKEHHIEKTGGNQT